MRAARLLLLLFFLCASPVGFIAEAGEQLSGNMVTFQVSTIDLPDSVTVYISGSDSLLGYWNPGQVPLEKTSAGLWEISLPFHTEQVIEYKFTLGTWAVEALDSAGAIPENHKLKVFSDTVVTHVVTAWNNKSRPVIQNTLCGLICRHQALQYPGILPRDLIVWLPPGYDTDSGRRYPVLYMHDGQNIFDRRTAAFGHELQLDETINYLVSRGKMEPIIVVGIYNTSDRSKEYAPGELGEKYMHFVIDKVKPLIDRTYRTRPGSKSTVTGGSSQGGLIALMLFWEFPDVFSGAICNSPAFRFKDVDYIDRIRSHSRTTSDANIYLDIGTVGLDSLLLPQFYEMAAALNAQGFYTGAGLRIYIDPGGEHSEVFWARRFWRPLCFFWAVRN